MLLTDSDVCRRLSLESKNAALLTHVRSTHGKLLQKFLVCSMVYLLQQEYWGIEERERERDDTYRPLRFNCVFCCHGFEQAVYKCRFNAGFLKIAGPGESLQ